MKFLKMHSGTAALIGACVFAVAVILLYLPLTLFGFIPAASYFGTLAGASVGFAGLIAGHLYNSRLNRDRDERLRILAAADCAAAVQAEIQQNSQALRNFLDFLTRDGPYPNQFIEVIAAHFSTQVFDDNIVNFCVGIVATKSDEELRKMLEFYSTIRFLRIGFSTAREQTKGRENALPEEVAILKFGISSAQRQAETARLAIERIRVKLAIMV